MKPYNPTLLEKDGWYSNYGKFKQGSSYLQLLELRRVIETKAATTRGFQIALPALLAKTPLEEIANELGIAVDSEAYLQASKVMNRLFKTIISGDGIERSISISDIINEDDLYRQYADEIIDLIVTEGAHEFSEIAIINSIIDSLSVTDNSISSEDPEITKPSFIFETYKNKFLSQITGKDVLPDATIMRVQSIFNNDMSNMKFIDESMREAKKNGFSPTSAVMAVLPELYQSQNVNEEAEGLVSIEVDAQTSLGRVSPLQLFIEDAVENLEIAGDVAVAAAVTSGKILGAVCIQISNWINGFINKLSRDMYKLKPVAEYWNSSHEWYITDKRDLAIDSDGVPLFDETITFSLNYGITFEDFKFDVYQGLYDQLAIGGYLPTITKLFGTILGKPSITDQSEAFAYNLYLLSEVLVPAIKPGVTKSYSSNGIYVEVTGIENATDPVNFIDVNIKVFPIARMDKELPIYTNVTKNLLGESFKDIGHGSDADCEIYQGTLSKQISYPVYKIVTDPQGQQDIAVEIINQENLNSSKYGTYQWKRLYNDDETEVYPAEHVLSEAWKDDSVAIANILANASRFSQSIQPFNLDGVNDDITIYGDGHKCFVPREFGITMMTDPEIIKSLIREVSDREDISYDEALTRINDLNTSFNPLSFIMKVKHHYNGTVTDKVNKYTISEIQAISEKAAAMMPTFGERVWDEIFTTADNLPFIRWLVPDYLVGASRRWEEQADELMSEALSTIDVITNKIEATEISFYGQYDINGFEDQLFAVKNDYFMGSGNPSSITINYNDVQVERIMCLIALFGCLVGTETLVPCDPLIKRWRPASADDIKSSYADTLLKPIGSIVLRVVAVTAAMTIGIHVGFKLLKMAPSLGLKAWQFKKRRDLYGVDEQIEELQQYLVDNPTIDPVYITTILQSISEKVSKVEQQSKVTYY